MIIDYETHIKLIEFAKKYGISQFGVHYLKDDMVDKYIDNLDDKVTIDELQQLIINGCILHIKALLKMYEQNFKWRHESDKLILCNSCYYKLRSIKDEYKKYNLIQFKDEIREATKLVNKEKKEWLDLINELKKFIQERIENKNINFYNYENLNSDFKIICDKMDLYDIERSGRRTDNYDAKYPLFVLDDLQMKIWVATADILLPPLQ